jgi:hypothetical protein
MPRWILLLGYVSAQAAIMMVAALGVSGFELSPPTLSLVLWVILTLATAARVRIAWLLLASYSMFSLMSFSFVFGHRVDELAPVLILLLLIAQVVLLLSLGTRGGWRHWNR